MIVHEHQRHYATWNERIVVNQRPPRCDHGASCCIVLNDTLHSLCVNQIKSSRDNIKIYFSISINISKCFFDCTVEKIVIKWRRTEMRRRSCQPLFSTFPCTQGSLVHSWARTFSNWCRDDTWTSGESKKPLWRIQSEASRAVVIKVFRSGMYLSRQMSILLTFRSCCVLMSHTLPGCFLGGGPSGWSKPKMLWTSLRNWRPSVDSGCLRLACNCCTSNRKIGLGVAMMLGRLDHHVVSVSALWSLSMEMSCNRFTV